MVNRKIENAHAMQVSTITSSSRCIKRPLSPCCNKAPSVKPSPLEFAALFVNNALPVASRPVYPGGKPRCSLDTSLNILRLPPDHEQKYRKTVGRNPHGLEERLGNAAGGRCDFR